MSGFRINGKHINEEFPLLELVDRSTPHPEEILMKDSVMGMQGDRDFAIPLFGERIYKNRPLEYTFKGHEYNNAHKLFDKRMLENWLLTGTYTPLYDDNEPMYYYMARCVGVVLNSDSGNSESLYTLTFDAYPFKIKEAKEGSPYWDDYDISDYYQESKHTINGSKTIQFMNTGSKGVAPKIVASAPFTITKGNQSLTVGAGTSENKLFRFEMGMNTMTVTGNGTIEFIFHKELI